MPTLTINGVPVNDITLGGHSVTKIEDSNGNVLYESGPKFFTLTNTYAGNNTLTITVNGTPASTDLAYSVDGGSWTSVDMTAATTTVQVPEGGNVKLRSSTGFSSTSYDYIKLSMSQIHTASGDIRTLFDYTDVESVTAIPTRGLTNFLRSDTHMTDASGIDFNGISQIGDYGMSYAFEGCSMLTAMPDMSSVTSIGNYGMQYICWQCASLTSGPDLSSVTSIGQYCLYTAFSGCISMTTAPDIRSVSTLGNNSLAFMCGGCSTLSVAYMPNVNSWTTGDYGSANWFSGVSASGVIWKNAALNKTAQELGCPSEWTTRNYSEMHVTITFDTTNGNQIHYSTSDGREGTFVDYIGTLEISESQTLYLTTDGIYKQLYKNNVGQGCGNAYTYYYNDLSNGDVFTSVAVESDCSCWQELGYADVEECNCGEFGEDCPDQDECQECIDNCGGDPDCEAECYECDNPCGEPCLDCSVCSNWEECGYADYEDCQCQQHGECGEEEPSEEEPEE